MTGTNHLSALPATDEITGLLREWSRGNPQATEKLFPLVYGELHKIAACCLANNSQANQTLQTTVLVNEAFLHLAQWKGVMWKNRAHFFATASKIMRRIVIDWARSQGSAKRGGLTTQTPLDEAAVPYIHRALELLALDEALNHLEKIDPQLSQIVELRYFGGLTVEETAESLEVSVATVKREWNTARAFLNRALLSL